MLTRWGIGVRINGQDVGPVVVEGGKIERGRQDVAEDPQPDTLVMTLFTKDGWPQNPLAWFDYGVGQNTGASHFNIDHDTDDVYYGPPTWIGIGAEIWVSATTDTHFTPDHDTQDTYLGAEYRRFTGEVNALDYEYERLHLSAVGNLEEWARTALMTQPSDSPPVNPSDVDLALWLCAHTPSPTTLHIEGPEGPVMYPWPAAMYPLCLLDTLHALAADADAVIYAKRDGNVTYQTRGWNRGPVTQIPPRLLDLDALSMQLELGNLRNHVTVEYGPVIPGTPPGWPDRAQHIQIDSGSVSDYGKRQDYQDSRLVTAAAAQDHATTILNKCALEWVLPDLPLPMILATYADVETLTALDIGWLVRVPLPGGAPLPEIDAEVLGYTEFLSSFNWDIELHLGPTYTRVTGS